jgi:hypothetical protein
MHDILGLLEPRCINILPGGSGVGSERIWHALNWQVVEGAPELLKAAHLTVIAEFLTARLADW